MTTHSDNRKNVVSLLSAKPRDILVAKLSDLLAAAKQGKIVAFYFVGLSNDRSVIRAVDADDGNISTLAGGLSTALASVNKYLLDTEDSYDTLADPEPPTDEAT